MKAELFLLFPFMATLMNVLFVAIIQHSRFAHAHDTKGQQQQQQQSHARTDHPTSRIEMQSRTDL